MNPQNQKIKFVCPLITVADVNRSRNFYEKELIETILR